jgi:hypothetical protein
VRLFGLNGDAQGIEKKHLNWNKYFHNSDYFLVDFTRAMLSHTKHADFAVHTSDVRLVATVRRGTTLMGKFESSIFTLFSSYVAEELYVR